MLSKGGHERNKEVGTFFELKTAGDLFELAAKSLKAMLDMKAVESKTKERYTSTKFRGNQLRIATDNPYDDKVNVRPGMTLKEFMQLIAPAFHPKMDPKNLEAVLERSVVMVNTKDYLVTRLPFATGVEVMPWPTGQNYMENGCGKILEDFFVNGKARENFEEMVVEEQRLLKEVFEGRFPEEAEPVRIIPPTPASQIAPHDVATFDRHGDYLIPVPVVSNQTSDMRRRFKVCLSGRPSSSSLGAVPSGASSATGGSTGMQQEEGVNVKREHVEVKGEIGSPATKRARESDADVIDLRTP